MIREIENTNPKRILSLVPSQNTTSLTYNDIFQLKSYNSILDEIAKRIYRALENERSTPKLLDKFIRITNLNVPDNLKQDALIYLEVRHLIIHGNSKADVRFINMNQHGLVKVNSSNKKLTINYAMTSDAIIKVNELCEKIDTELINKALICV